MRGEGTKEQRVTGPFRCVIWLPAKGALAPGARLRNCRGLTRANITGRRGFDTAQKTRQSTAARDKGG
jgi:hypothetical protein